MPDTPTTETSKTKAAATPSATDECKVCHELRGSAPEGLYDTHTAFKAGKEPGDPKWESSKCWKCGAEY